MAKTLLVDERPHAMLLLREGILRGEDPDDSTESQGKLPKSAKVETGGATYAGFYTKILDQLLKVVLQLPNAMRDKDIEASNHALAPLRIALNGVGSAFVTASLNAALESISAEHRVWWEE